MVPKIIQIDTDQIARSQNSLGVEEPRSEADGAFPRRSGLSCEKLPMPVGSGIRQPIVTSEDNF